MTVRELGIEFSPIAIGPGCLQDAFLRGKTPLF